MYASTLIALLLSVTTVTANPPSSPEPEAFKFSIGAMSLTGDLIKLTKSEDTSFKCVVEGHATLTLGDDTDSDIALAASKMKIVRNADSSVTVRCVGDCRLTDSDYAITADQMNTRFTERMETEMSGHVRITYGHGDNRTTLPGETVFFRDSVFDISGTASLQRGP